MTLDRDDESASAPLECMAGRFDRDVGPAGPGSGDGGLIRLVPASDRIAVRPMYGHLIDLPEPDWKLRIFGRDTPDSRGPSR